uniref:Uncharacterized protein n=1 Tax=Tanacetum cinerariifolium TaxID=118510 RepID=A0A6L2LGU5_TANCI|nr:hypothetical protein [Tanacetum cinerariifolium]
MYKHYEYGSHHNVGSSSSQPNVGGSSSQPNIGGSSSPVRHFSLDDDDFTQMYSPQFSESFHEEQSPVEEIEEIQVPKNEVEEVCRPRPMVEDKAKRKMKTGSTSSSSSFDVKVLAKMMANEYVTTSDLYNIQKNQEMSELLKIKKQEAGCGAGNSAYGEPSKRRSVI